MATGSSAAAAKTDHATDHLPWPDAAVAHAALIARGAPRMAAGSATWPPSADVAAASAWPSAAANTASATMSTPAAARTVSSEPWSEPSPCPWLLPLSTRRSSSRCPSASSIAVELDSGPSAQPFCLSRRFLSSLPRLPPDRLPWTAMNLSAARTYARYPSTAPTIAGIHGACPWRHLRTTPASRPVADMAAEPAATAMSSATSSTDESLPLSSSPPFSPPPFNPAPPRPYRRR